MQALEVALCFLHNVASMITACFGKRKNVLVPTWRTHQEATELHTRDHVDLKLVVKAYVENRHNVGRVCKDSSVDPHNSPYPEVFGIPDAYHLFYLHHGGMPERKRKQLIATVKSYHAHQKSNFLGYQLNFAINYQRHFGSYLDTHVNNVGDPFKDGNVTMNSKFMERAVLDYFAALWHAKWPHCDRDPESYWGFFLSMGCTEGNLYSMWNAREYLGGKKILLNNQVMSQRQGGDACSKPKGSPKAHTPITFYSKDTHYSVAKAMAMLNLRTFYSEGRKMYPGQCPITEDGDWPTKVPSDNTGAINVDNLAALVEFFATHGYPIIVCFNYGTTFTGAHDDVAFACHKLKPILEKYNLFEREVQYIDDDGTTKVDTRTGYWFHVDGALGAAYMPFIEMAYHGGLVDKKGPIFDFRLQMVHSIAMSGHKWIGTSLPCGIYMTRTKYQMLPPEIPEYTGTPDTTFSGSRNGLCPMLLWDYIARHSYEDQITKAVRLQDLATYTERRLRCLQDRILKRDLYVDRSPLALTVRFKRANVRLCKKYSLSNEVRNGRQYSHVFLMEHVTHELVDAFMEELSREGAFESDITACSMDVETRQDPPPFDRIAPVRPSEGLG